MDLTLENIFNQISQLDPVHLHIFGQKYGSWLYGLLCAIIFLDTGLVFSPLLPGNSLIFTAGVLAANGALSPYLVLILLSLAAFLGDNTNYWIGRKVGHRLFGGPAVANFKSRALSKIQVFFSRHHRSAIVFAHFFPVLRGNSPFIAGATKVVYRHFLILSLIGSCTWVAIVVTAGYFLGKLPAISNNIFAFILITTILPSLPLFGIFFRIKQKNTRS